MQNAAPFFFPLSLSLCSSYTFSQIARSLLLPFLFTRLDSPLSCLSLLQSSAALPTPWSCCPLLLIIQHSLHCPSIHPIPLRSPTRTLSRSFSRSLNSSDSLRLACSPCQPTHSSRSVIEKPA